MNILILDAGAMGGYYGAKLLQAGADVTFLVRPSRKVKLQRDGLTVRGGLIDFAGAVRTITRDELKSLFELVVVSCKGYDLDGAINDIEPAVGPHTAILPWLNGLAPYDRLDAAFGRDVMLCAGAAMNCLMRGSVADILGTEGGHGLMGGMIAECLEVASREGHALSDSAASLIDARLLDIESSWAASMMRDIAAGAPRLETETIVGDMVRRASAHRLTTPLLRAAHCHLQVYESR